MPLKRQAASEFSHSESAKRIRFATQSLQSGARPSAQTAQGARNDDSDGGEDYNGDVGMEEQDRKRAQQGRRGRLVTDMSDSDGEEEDEPEDGVAQEAAREGSDQSDDDMFGPGSEPQESQPQQKNQGRPKDTKHLALDDISDQEFGAATRAPDREGNLADHPESEEEFLQDVDPEFELESSEEDVPDDGPSGDADRLNEDPEQEEDLSGRPAAWEEDEDNPYRGLTKRQRAKRKKGMGYKVEEFNLKNELELGQFDQDGGNYIENAKDPHSEQDAWLKGNYNRKVIKQARQAQLKRQRDLEQWRPEEKLSVPSLKSRLAEHLLRGESVLEALHRLGMAAHPRSRSGKGKVRVQKSDNGKGKSQSNNISGEDQHPDGDLSAAQQADEAKRALEALTSYASILMAEHGLTAIYDETYEGLLRAARRAKVVDAEWDPARTKEAKRHSEHEGTTLNQKESSEWGNGTEDASASASHISTDTTTGRPLPDKHYVYRYSPAYLAQTGAPEIQVFGPFPGSDLLAWGSQGYFGPGQDRILLQLAPAGDQAPDPDAWTTWQNQ